MFHHIFAMYWACMKLYWKRKCCSHGSEKFWSCAAQEASLSSSVSRPQEHHFLSPQMKIKLLVPPVYSTVIVKHLSSLLCTVGWWQCNSILYGTSRGYIIGVGFSFPSHFFPEVSYLTLTSGCIFFSLRFSIIRYLVWLQSLDFNGSDILIFKGINDFIKIMSFR